MKKFEYIVSAANGNYINEHKYVRNKCIIKNFLELFVFLISKLFVNISLPVVINSKISFAKPYKKQPLYRLPYRYV